jgi:hypothetical protein
MRGADRAAQVASAHWETLTAEAEAIAAEAEEEGWEALVVHSGSVTAVHERDRCGLDVLIPGNEYEPLAALVEDRGLSFPRSEVYCREEGDVVLLVVAVRDPESETAVVFPAYYDREEAEETFERAAEEGSFRTYLRKLNREAIVFSHDDPSIFEPE